MTDLPALKWRASPNFGARGGTRVDQIVIHDTEGGYSGSVEWFAQARSQVSAHFVVREDGGEATQMVHLSDRAWHACAANSRSVGIEMAGFAAKGYAPGLLEGTAALAAELCHYLQIPVRHARGGVGPGIESHWGLGKAGGGHSDPSTDPAWMERFVAMTQAEYGKGYDPQYLDIGAPPACKLTPPQETTESDITFVPLGIDPTDLGVVKGLQLALNTSGATPPLVIDGILGPRTQSALESLQIRVQAPLIERKANPIESPSGGATGQHS